MVILGDNIYGDDLTNYVDAFENGAMVFLKEVENPEEYGVVRLEDDEIVEIIEKPESPPSNLAVTGAYIYDNDVFDIIKTLEPSDRGEFEITDVNMAYLREGKLKFHILNGFWGDAGESIDALYEVSQKVKKLGL
jgi:glucose-1-phosphate thymidylyltransferase